MARTMLQTQISEEVSRSQSHIVLDSVSGISPGTLLFVDREAILVLSEPVGNRIDTTRRGAQSTAGSAHIQGATVYYGPPNSFALFDPAGAFPVGADIYLPRVVIPSGKVWNNSGGVWTEVGGGGGGLSGPQGTATLNFGAIEDGGSAELTFTVTGALVGDKVAPSWPSTMDAGIVGSMFVSATNTIMVRLVNLSGATIDPASSSYGAQIVR